MAQSTLGKSVLYFLCTARGLWSRAILKGAHSFLARTFHLVIGASKLVAWMSTELMSSLWCPFCINMKKKKFLVGVGVIERFEKSSLRFLESTFLPYHFFWAATVSYMGALFGRSKHENTERAAKNCDRLVTAAHAEEYWGKHWTPPSTC